MNQIFGLIKYIPVLAAAYLLGNWFLTELKKANAQNKPWYAAYLTIPGILIIIALMIPFILKLFDVN